MTSGVRFAVTLGTSVGRLRACWWVSSVEIIPLISNRSQLTSDGYTAR